MACGRLDSAAQGDACLQKQTLCGFSNAMTHARARSKQGIGLSLLQTHQQVLRLDVPVADAARVEVGQGARKLVDVQLQRLRRMQA